MKNRGLECLGWVIIVVVAFWAGWLVAPEKVRVEKIRGPETVIYKLDEIPLNAITAYLGLSGLEILPKAEADKIKAEAHSYWQEGYKEGFRKGCR